MSKLRRNLRDSAMIGELCPQTAACARDLRQDRSHSLPYDAGGFASVNREKPVSGKSERLWIITLVPYLVDIAVVTTVGLSALSALIRGFALEVFATAAWLGAAVLTVVGLPLVEPQVARWVDVPLLSNGVTAVVLFLFALVLLSILARLLARPLSRGTLRSLNRGLGLIFGAARGWLLLVACWIALEAFMAPSQRPPWLVQARAAPWLAHSSVVVLRLFSDAQRRSLIQAIPGESPEDAQNSPQQGAPLSPDGSVNGDDGGYSGNERSELERLFNSLAPKFSQ